MFFSKLNQEHIWFVLTILLDHREIVLVYPIQYYARGLWLKSWVMSYPIIISCEATGVLHRLDTYNQGHDNLQRGILTVFLTGLLLQERELSGLHTSIFLLLWTLAPLSTHASNPRIVGSMTGHKSQCGYMRVSLKAHWDLHISAYSELVVISHQSPRSCWRSTTAHQNIGSNCPLPTEVGSDR